MAPVSKAATNQRELEALTALQTFAMNDKKNVELVASHLSQFRETRCLTDGLAKFGVLTDALRNGLKAAGVDAQGHKEPSASEFLHRGAAVLVKEGHVMSAVQDVTLSARLLFASYLADAYNSFRAEREQQSKAIGVSAWAVQELAKHGVKRTARWLEYVLPVGRVALCAPAVLKVASAWDDAKSRGPDGEEESVHTSESVDPLIPPTFTAISDCARMILFACMAAHHGWSAAWKGFSVVGVKVRSVDPSWAAGANMEQCQSLWDEFVRNAAPSQRPKVSVYCDALATVVLTRCVVVVVVPRGLCS